MNGTTAVETFSFTLNTAEPLPETAPPDASVSTLWQTILGLVEQMKELATETAELRAELNLQRAKRFGQSSERQKREQATTDKEEEAESSVLQLTSMVELMDTGQAQPRRKRGGQPGHRGVGRSIPEHLTREIRWVELPESERHCPHCQCPYRELALTEDSEEVDVEVNVRVIRYRRKRYEKRCNCPGAKLVTAPVVPKLIPKGKFSVPTWVKFLVDKYQAQVPITRQIQMLQQADLPVAKGTVHGGFQKLADYLEPLYEHFVVHLRTAGHLHADETRWLVFEEVAGKANHRWWLWLFASQEVAAFVLDPSRSAQVPRKALSEKVAAGETPAEEAVVHEIEGESYAVSASIQTISADRYCVYPAISKRIRVAFCWAHQRRDFVDLKKAYTGQPEYSAWTDEWLDDIAQLYTLNKGRLAVRDQPESWAVAQSELESAVAAMKEKTKKRTGLTERQRKALESLKRHWKGLTLFVANPDIPMDNNLAERLLRGPVVGRKNYYGHQAQWSGELAAMMFTIIQTCQLNDINPYRFLVDYFDTCAQCGGTPTDLNSFSPWALKDQGPVEEQYPP